MLTIIKKLFSLSLSAVAVLVLSGFLSLKPINSNPAALPTNAVAPAYAHHTDTHECNDITMVPSVRAETDPVLSPAMPGREGGIADSGTLNFDEPSKEYQACAERAAQDWLINSQPADTTGNFMRGWVWNTNLGDVSFYCKNGANFGRENCGGIDYGTLYLQDGRMRGFAWGDNIGWISMGCDNGTNLGVSCGASDYGVRAALENDVTPDAKFGSCRGTGPGGKLNRGELYGYAWSDSVGWLNFCGSHVNISNLGALNAALNISPSVISATANGNDFYAVRVNITENNEALKNPEQYSLVVEGGFGANTVRSDQITPCTTNCAYDAVTVGQFSWDSASAGFVSNVTSIAPTSSTDSLLLNTLTVSLQKGGATVQTFEFSVANGPLPYSFEFAAPVELTDIASEDTSGTFTSGTITTVANAIQHIRITATHHTISGIPADSAISVITQLYDCSPEYDFSFYDEGSNASIGAVTADSLGTFPAIVNNSICTGGGGLTGIDSIGLDNFTDIPAISARRAISTTFAPGMTPTSLESSNAIGLQTIVNYAHPSTGKSVRYFSKRISDGSVLNQAADIRGDVKIDVIDASGLPAVNRIMQSVGQRAKSKREPFYKIIRNLIGRPPLSSYQTTKTMGASDISNAPANGVLYYHSAPTASVPCTIILDDANDITLNKKVTLVAEGCNVFIDQNILSDIGVIALEDIKSGMGGNVYICSRATDVTAAFMVDGTIFSYGLSENDCGGSDKSNLVDFSTGYPNFGAASAPIREVLKFQLTLTGSIISNNTLGGALRTPPLLGDGRVATTAEEIARSRLTDLNLLRYAQTRPRPNVPGKFCWDTDVTLSKTFTPSGLSNDSTCFSNHPGSDVGAHGIVNILYRPATTLPVFKLVK